MAGPIPFQITVNGEYFTIVRTRDDINPSWAEEQSANSTLYSISGNTVVWENGGILQLNSVDVLPTDEIDNTSYTTRAATSQKSYDLSTSSKWSALSDGEHTVEIVAKGTGYRDSAKSTSVTVTKGSTGETWILKNQKPSSPSGNYLDLPIDTAVYAKSGTVYKWINYNEAREINGGVYGWAIKYVDSCLYIGGYDTYGDPAIPVYDGKYDNKWIFGFWDDGVTESTAPTDTTNLRTIKFYSAPTGDLLSWLQANATKQ